MPTFEELNAMTKIELIDFASKKKVPNFKKSWSKKEMIENICNHLDCDKPAKRGRSRSRSPSVKRSSSKSPKSKSVKSKSKSAKSKSRSPSKSKKSAKSKSASRGRSRSRSSSKSSRSSSKSSKSSKSPSDLSKMKVAELRELAKKLGIKGAAKKKDDLIDQIKKEMKSSSKSPSKSPSKSKKQSSRSSKKQEYEIPSYSEEQLNGMTITNLKILAKQLGIKGSDKYKSANKGDLIKEIIKKMGTSSQPSSPEPSSRESSVPPSESSSRESSVPPSESSSRESSVPPSESRESDFDERRRGFRIKLMDKLNEARKNRIEKDTPEITLIIETLAAMQIELQNIEEEVKKNGESDDVSRMLEKLIDEFDAYLKTGHSEKYSPKHAKSTSRKSKKRDTDEVVIDGQKVSGDSESIEGLKSVLGKPINISQYDVEDKPIVLPPRDQDFDEDDLIGKLKGLREEIDDVEKLDLYQKELLKCLNMTKKK